MRLKYFVVALAITLFSVGAVFAQGDPAKKITPYFQIRFFTGMSYVDDDLNGGESDIDFRENQLVTTRMGLKGTAGKLSGNVEVGLKGSSYSNAVYLRHAYAKYTTGNLEILFGQTWTPYFALMDSQAEDFVGIGYGATYDGRLPQVRVTYYGAYVALIQPTTIASGTTASTNDSVTPKVATGYNYKSKLLDISPGFALTYEKPETGDGILSWLAYVHGSLKFFNPFYSTFNATFSQNPGDFGIYQKSIVSLKGDSITSGGNAKGTDDVYVFEGFLELGYKFEMGKLGGGVGYVRNFDNKDDRIAYFVQFCFYVEQNFKITPSFLYVDQIEEGSEFVTGVKLQANF